MTNTKPEEPSIIIVPTSGIVQENEIWTSNILSYMRLYAAALLYKHLQIREKEPTVIISGGKIYADAPSLAEVISREAKEMFCLEKIITENHSIDTDSNAKNSLRIAKLIGASKIYPVTTDFHLERFSRALELSKFQEEYFPITIERSAEYLLSNHCPKKYKVELERHLKEFMNSPAYKKAKLREKVFRALQFIPRAGPALMQASVKFQLKTSKGRITGDFDYPLAHYPIYNFLREMHSEQYPISKP